MSIIHYLQEQILPLRFLGLLVSAFCGLIVGFERQYFGKPAGIRTSILICSGAYCFVALSSSLIDDSTDNSRVVGQIVTGIGFLGAGIMFNNGALVQGVTSAAVIWVIAAIGCLVGFDNYGAAIMMTFMTLGVLLGITFLERKIKGLKQGVHKY